MLEFSEQVEQSLRAALATDVGKTMNKWTTARTNVIAKAASGACGAVLMALDTDEQRRPKIDWVTELAWVLVGVVLSDRAKALAGRYIDKDETKMIRTLVRETAEGVAGKSTSVGLGKLREHGSSEVSVKHSRAEAAKLIFRAQAFKDAFEARQYVGARGSEVSPRSFR